MDHLLETKKYKNLRKKNLRYTHQNDLDKACFQHDMADGDFQALPCDEVLHNKAFNNATNPKYDGYQCGLASMVYK